MKECSLSFDPGLVVTAFVAWENNQPVITDNAEIKLKGRMPTEKCQYLWKQLHELFDGVNITAIAYEDNGARAPRERYASIAESRRAVQTILCYAWSRGIKTIEIGTGKDCKQDAAIMARKYRYEGKSIHVPDALLVGVLAGFGER